MRIDPPQASGSNRTRWLRALVCALGASLLGLGCQPTNPFADDDDDLWGDDDDDVWGDDDDAGELIGLGISPQLPVMTLGEDLQFTAIGFYSGGTTSDLTSAVDWSSSDLTIATISNGLDSEGTASALDVGHATIMASLDGYESNGLLLRVTDAELLDLQVEPVSVVLAQGESIDFALEATFSDGSHGSVSTDARWSSTDGNVATINADGHLVARGEGTVEVLAVVGERQSNSALVQVVGDDVTVLPPDLRVTAFEAVAVEGEILTVIDIINEGGTSSGEFFVELFLDPETPPAPPDAGEGWDYLPFLGPAEVARLNSRLPAAPGTHEIYVLVDGLNAVEEGEGEGDNLAGPYVVEVPEVTPTLPDLRVASLTGIASGADTTYYVEVVNEGLLAANAFWIDIWKDRTTRPGTDELGDVYEQVREPLPPGESRIVTVVLPGQVPSDSWQSWCMLDSNGAIYELNEDNNAGGPATVYGTL